MDKMNNVSWLLFDGNILRWVSITSIWRKNALEEHIIKSQGKACENLRILLLLLTKQKKNLYTFKCHVPLLFCAFNWPHFTSSPNSTHKRSPQNRHRSGTASGCSQDLGMKQFHCCQNLPTHIFMRYISPVPTTQSNREKIADPLMSEKSIKEVNLT